MKEELAVGEIAEDVGKGKAGERKKGEREERREGRQGRGKKGGRKDPGLGKLLSAWIEVARRREIRLIDAITPFMMILTSNSKDPTNDRCNQRNFNTTDL